MRDRAPSILFCLVILIISFWALQAEAETDSPTAKFPPPEFDADYQLPPTEQPPPRAKWLNLVDVLALTVALTLAAWLSLKRRSRKGMIALSVASLAYFGFYWHGRICPMMTIENVSLALSGSGYVMPLTMVAFLLLPLGFAIFFGRAFCAGVCPHGMIQDLVLLKPIRLPRWLEHSLGLLAYIYLGLALLFAGTNTMFIIYRYDPFAAFFRLSGQFHMLMLGGAFLILGIFIGRPYCRFLCPYGVLLRLVSRGARWNVSTTPDDCIACGLCADACPFGALNGPSQEQALSRKNKYLVIVLVIALIVGCGWLGSYTGNFLAGFNRTVKMAHGLNDQNRGVESQPSLEVETFLKGEISLSSLRQEARQIKRSFLRGGTWLGIWCGLVFGLKILGLTRKKKMDIFAPDPSLCFSCGRCYSYCPRERLRLKKKMDK